MKSVQVSTTLTLLVEKTDKGTSINNTKNTLFMDFYRDAATSLRKVLYHISVEMKECYHCETSFKMLYSSCQN